MNHHKPDFGRTLLFAIAWLWLAWPALADHHETGSLLEAGEWAGSYQPLDSDPVDVSFTVARSADHVSGWSLQIQMHLDPRADWLFSAKDLKVDGERVKFHFGRMGDERRCRLKPVGESELVGECRRLNEAEGQAPSRIVMKRPAGEPASD
jgi:hypothetical protein